MSKRLERRCRWLLLAYPPDYRAAHGEEIIGTLLEAASPTQRFPSGREATGLLLGGLRTRARQASAASPPRVWTPAPCWPCCSRTSTATTPAAPPRSRGSGACG